MARELEVIKTDVFTNEEKAELNAEIDRIIEAHKNNRQEINRLVFESVSAMTAADEADEELSSKGFFSRIWGSITGSNQRLQNKINKNRAAAQYASQQTLQKLAEQNLMSFDLITAVNNKLNASLTAVDSEFRNIYDGLAKFLRHNKNELARLETRLEKVERNVNLLTWQNSIEYQEFNGEEYIDMDAPSKIACLVSDFYEITKGEWSTSDLLLLKTAMATIDLQPKDKVNYFGGLLEISRKESIKDKLLGGKVIKAISDPGYLLSISTLTKLDSLKNEEGYIVETVSGYLSENNLDSDADEISANLTSKYMKQNADVNLDVDIECYDFILDLLYNIKQANEDGLIVNKEDAVALLESSEKNEEPPVEEKIDADAIFVEAKKHFEIGEDDDDDDEYKKAAELFEKAANHGHSDAQDFLGYQYEFGLGIAESKQEAIKWYTLSAEQGNADGQFSLATIYEKDNDIETANKWYKKAVRNKQPYAMCKLANNYRLGKGIEENHAKALELYKESADLGLPEAQCALGTIYKEGLIVEKDYKKAREYYEKAVEQGFAPAQVYLGLMYKQSSHYDIRDENGCYYNDKVAYKKAVELFRLAANQGDAKGQNNLAIMLLAGRGIDKDEKSALELFIKAADQDYAPAIYNIKAAGYLTFGFLGFVKAIPKKYQTLYDNAEKEGRFNNLDTSYNGTSYSLAE